MRAESAGQFADALHRLSSPRSLTMSVAPNSVGQRNPVGMAAEDDDPLGAEALRGDHAAQSDGAVADHRCRLSRARHALPGARRDGPST